MGEWKTIWMDGQDEGLDAKQFIEQMNGWIDVKKIDGLLDDWLDE